MSFQRKFVVPGQARKWWQRCSECDAEVEGGQSCATGKKVSLCYKCTRIIKEAMRP